MRPELYFFSIMAQNATSIDCGGNYLMSITHLGLYSLLVVAVILITPFAMTFPLTIRPVNSFHQATSIFSQIKCHMTEPRSLQNSVLSDQSCQPSLFGRETPSFEGLLPVSLFLEKSPCFENISQRLLFYIKKEKMSLYLSYQSQSVGDLINY